MTDKTYNIFRHGSGNYRLYKEKTNLRFDDLFSKVTIVYGDNTKYQIISEMLNILNASEIYLICENETAQKFNHLTINPNITVFNCIISSPAISTT